MDSDGAEVMAKTVWVCAVVATTIVIVALGLADWSLWWQGKETVTDWLREHEAWFWVPVCVLWAAILILALHLFAE